MPCADMETKKIHLRNDLRECLCVTKRCLYFQAAKCNGEWSVVRISGDRGFSLAYCVWIVMVVVITHPVYRT